MRGLTIVASGLDVAMAAIMAAMSGFIFGGGPEGMNGEINAATLWWVRFVPCLAAPVAGFACGRFRRAGLTGS